MFALCSIFLVFLLAQGGLSDICVENNRVYHLVDDHVDHTIYRGRDFGRTFGLNSDLYKGLNRWNQPQERGLYNKDYFLNKIYNRDYDRSVFGGLFGKSLYNRNIYDHRDVYDQDYVNRNVYRTVGDFKGIDNDFRGNFYGRSEIDRSYRMDFYKNTFGIVKSRNECDCVCPNSIPKGDLTDKVIVDVAQKDLLNKLWNNSQLPRLTLLGKRMKNAILHLINSDVPVFQRHGLIMSIFLFSYYPHNELNLDFCPFAKVIDASVEYKKNNDVGKVLESIDIMGRTIYDATQLIGSSVMFYGKCGVIKPDVTRDNCVGNGFVYQFEEIWNMEGGQLPSFYREVAYDLYRSEHPIDKLMAVIASAALTPQLNEIVNDWNVYPMFEIVNMLATDNVPSCCCSFRMHRLQELMSIATQEISRNTVLAKNSFTL